jgi:hypothetical protein
MVLCSFFHHLTESPLDTANALNLTTGFHGTILVMVVAFLHHLWVSLSPCPLKGHDGSHALSLLLQLLRLYLVWNRRRRN